MPGNAPASPAPSSSPQASCSQLLGSACGAPGEILQSELRHLTIRRLLVQAPAPPQAPSLTQTTVWPQT